MDTCSDFLTSLETDAGSYENSFQTLSAVRSSQWNLAASSGNWTLEVLTEMTGCRQAELSNQYAPSQSVRCLDDWKNTLAAGLNGIRHYFALTQFRCFQ